MASFTPEQLNKFKLDYDNGMYKDSPVADSIRQKIELQGSIPTQSQQPEQAPERTVSGTVQDIGTSIARGVLGAGESLVGLADIATGGHAGKFLEDKAGYKIGDLSAELSDNYSPAQQAVNKKIASSSGFLETLGTAIQNPSSIASAVIESAPSMLLGGGIGRGLTYGATKAAPALKLLGKRTLGTIGSATGEGLVQAGSMAEQVRGQTDDGLLTAGQIAKSIGSGIGTGALTLVGGKLAKKFGFSDVDTLLAGGGLAAKSEGNVISRIIKGGISEGVFEELPQSIQEQIWMNSATGKPLTEGIGEAGAMGMLAGVTMGGGTNIMAGNEAGDKKPFVPKPKLGLPDQLKAINDKIEKVSQLDMSLASAKELKNLYEQANTIKNKIKPGSVIEKEKQKINKDIAFKENLIFKDLELSLAAKLNKETSETSPEIDKLTALNNQILTLAKVEEPTVGQIHQLDLLQDEYTTLSQVYKEAAFSNYQNDYDDRQAMYNNLFSDENIQAVNADGTASEAAKDLKYVPRSGRPTDVITRAGIPYQRRDYLETYLNDMPNKDDYEIVEVSLHQFTKNLLAANLQKQSFLQEKLDTVDNQADRMQLLQDMYDVETEIINLTNKKENLESEAFNTEYPGQVGYVARLTDEAIDAKRPEVIAEREAQDKANEDQYFADAELSIRQQQNIKKLQTKYQQVKNDPNIPANEKQAILSSLDNVFDNILPKKNKIFAAAQKTQALINKLTEGTFRPIDQKDLNAAMTELKDEYKKLAAEEKDIAKSKDILTKQKQVVSLFRQVKELEKTADLTTRPMVESKIAAILNTEKPTKKQKLELKKLQKQIENDDSRQAKIIALNNELSTLFTDTDRTMSRRFQNNFVIQRTMGDNNYLEDIPGDESSIVGTPNTVVPPETDRPNIEQQVDKPKTLTAASGIDQINQGISGRLVNKYPDLYSEPDEIDSDIELSSDDYDSIINYELTPAELEAKIVNHPNKDTYLKDLKTTIAQTLGDLEETYRYEGTQDGKVIEDYIDSLLAVIKKYSVSNTGMQNQNSATKVNPETKQVSNNSGIEKQSTEEVIIPDQATMPVEDTPAGADTNIPEAPINLKATIKQKQAELDQLFKSIPTIQDKKLRAAARQEFLNKSAEIEKLKMQQKTQLEVRENNVPGTGMVLKDIQAIYPNQNVLQSEDGKISVYFKNGKGVTFQNIQDAGDGYIQFAIDTNQMSKDGKILGITVGDKVLLDANFADKTTLWHENKHVLDNLGMITKEDNSVLTKEFNNLRKAGKLEFDLSTHEDPIQRMRENIANTFAQVMTQRESYRTGPLKTFIQKVMDFFERLFAFGKQTLSGLAREVESGKIYERTSDDMKSKALREGLPQFEIRNESSSKEEMPEIPQAELDRIFNQNKSLWTRVKQVTRMTKADSKLLADKLFGSISTRLKIINPLLSAKVRELDYRTGIKVASNLRTVLPIMEKARKKMTPQDRSAFDWARKQGNAKTINKITSKYGITAQYDQVRQMLAQIYKDGVDVGFDMGNIAEYWPRILKDQEGFLQKTQGISQRPEFTDALKAQADKMGISVGALDPVMRADIISNVILGVHAGIGGPGNTRSRVFDQIPEEFAEFYMDSDSAMMQYVYSMNKRIEARRFFGKVPEKITKAKQKLRADETRLVKYQELLKTNKAAGNIDENLISKVQNISDDIKLMNNIIEKYKHQRDFTENIGTYIDELRAKELIQKSDERTVRDILNARFHEQGTHGIVNAYKNAAYIDTMGSPLSAITQIGDLAWAYYIGGLTPAGIIRTTKNIVSAVMNKSEITKEDLGISRMAQEFADSDSLSNAVSKVFKAVGLEWMDSIGKEALINTSFENYKDKAKQDSAKLIKEINHIFGKESKQVVTDLLGNNPTDNVKLLVYNRLLDFQPVALSEMPELYLKSGNGRIFYMLKTYTMKQMDVFRREVYHNIKYGEKDQKIAGMRNMIKLGMLLTLANAGADEIKDFVLGKETKFSDNVMENLLTLGGASKYTKMQIRNDGIGSAYLDQILPPMKFVNSISKDVTGDVSDGLRSVDSIPGIGKLYYWHFGRGAENRPSQLEQDFKELNKDVRSFKEQLKNKEDKRTFLYENIDKVREMKKVENYQGILNKNTALINKLKEMPQTPNVLKRISQLQQRKELILKNFFKTKIN